MAAVAKKPWVGREVFIFFSYVLDVYVGFTEPRAGGEVISAKSLKTCTGMQRKFIAGNVTNETLPQSLEEVHVALGHSYITVSDKVPINWFSFFLLTYSVLVRALST